APVLASALRPQPSVVPLALVHRTARAVATADRVGNAATLAFITRAAVDGLTVVHAAQGSMLIAALSVGWWWLFRGDVPTAPLAASVSSMRDETRPAAIAPDAGREDGSAIASALPPSDELRALLRRAADTAVALARKAPSRGTSEPLPAIARAQVLVGDMA